MASSASGTQTTTGSVTLSKSQTEAVAFVQFTGTYGTVTGEIEGSIDGTTFSPIPYIPLNTGQLTNGTVQPSDNQIVGYRVPADGYTSIRFRVTAIASGGIVIALNSVANLGSPQVVVMNPVQYFPGAGTVGASTAAAGTTTADATVLPAGTAKIYPVSAADDTKGVRFHANDKVTGNVILVGNKVSNKILKVYAPTGGTINGAAADAAFSVGSGKSGLFACIDSATNAWVALG